jgi:hypothetical protein
MFIIGLLTLGLRAVESAWLILPQQGFSWAVWLLAPLALVAMTGLGAASVAALRSRLPDWFRGDRFVPEKPVLERS